MPASAAPAPSSSSTASSSSSSAPAFQVVTSERVPLRLPLAGIGERAIASSIDVIFIVLLLITLLFVYNLVRRGDLEQDVAQATTTMVLVIAGLMLAGIVAFDVVADVFFAGRTPGKRLAGLRVVDGRGRPPDLLTSLLRNLLRLVDMLPLGYGVGVVTMFFTGTRRLGDLVAGTVVVNERARGRAIVDELIAAAGTTTATTPRLDDDDVVRLVELVLRGVGLEPALADRLCASTATTLGTRLGSIDGPPRARLAAAVIAASSRPGHAARLWRLHDETAALRFAIADLDRGPSPPNPRSPVPKEGGSEGHADDVVRAVDDAARALASTLLQAERRNVPARWLEPASLALLEVERRRRAPRRSWWPVAVRWLLDDVPAIVWQERAGIVRAAVVFVGAVVVGAAIAFIDLDVGRALIGDDLMGLVEQGARWTDAIATDGRHLQTSIEVGLNNIGVGLRMFALGILGGVATLLGVVVNGVGLGATFGAAAKLGTVDTLARFILAHGPVELSMICVAAAGGFCLGRAVVSPGQRSRIAALRDEGRRGLALLTFATVGFAAIAGVEGFVSPGRFFPIAVNVGVGLTTWLLFFAWARRGLTRP